MVIAGAVGSESRRTAAGAGIRSALARVGTIVYLTGNRSVLVDSCSSARSSRAVAVVCCGEEVGLRAAVAEDRVWGRGVRDGVG